MKTNYKKLFFVAMLMFGLNACVDISPDGRGYTINVPLHVINTTVGQNFPQKQRTNYGTLLIDKPNILGKQGSNTLGVGTSFSFSNMLIPNGIKGTISLSSGVRYNPSNRGLYLTSPMIDELTFQNFSLSHYLTLEMRNIIGDIIAQQLMKKPIYRMNNMGASLVKSVGVQNGNLVVTLGL